MKKRKPTKVARKRQTAKKTARANGTSNFTVSDTQLAPLAQLDPSAVTDQLLANFLALPADPAFRDSVRLFLAADHSGGSQKLRRLRRATVTLLQSPEYQLC